jgi:hypothetical protein
MFYNPRLSDSISPLDGRPSCCRPCCGTGLVWLNEREQIPCPYCTGAGIQLTTTDEKSTEISDRESTEMSDIADIFDFIVIQSDNGE